MKKLFSIPFALLILLAGMHLSISTHICGKEVAAVKWSFSGKEATCGMETDAQTCPKPAGIHSNCCHNEIAVYSVDNNYVPSSLEFKKVINTLLLVFFIPADLTSHSFIASSTVSTNVSPPDQALTSDVNLADICVFRI